MAPSELSHSNAVLEDDAFSVINAQRAELGNASVVLNNLREHSSEAQQQALFEADTLENQMNEMFKELNEMQNMIKGNADLKTYENLKDTTKEVMDTHMSAYSKLKDNIIDITKDADSAIDDLNFYQEDDDDNFEAKTSK